MHRAKPRPEPRIETERLILRPPRMDDLGDIVAEINDWDIARMTARIPHPYGKSDGLAYLDSARVADAAGKTFHLALERDGRLIGMCSIFAMPHQPEVGYWLGRRHWGNGYMTEAAAAILTYGFEVLSLPLVRCKVAIDNPASQRVAAKLGFRRVGRVTGYSLARGGKVEHIDAVLTRRRYEALVR